jgi:5-methylcytosine-specific restriction endonuclease McrA
MKKKKKKERGYRWYKKKLDEVFSEYIRKRDKGCCFTCGRRADWQYSHAGHYINRNHLATRWNEKNVNAQCPACNLFRQGNKTVYATRLEEKYGHGILQELESLKNIGKVFNAEQTRVLIEYYKKLASELDISQ